MATKNPTTIIAEPGKQDIIVIREFEAPRELVFKAYTDPKLLVQWLGPREMKTKLDKFNCTTHGSYRFSHTDPKGNMYQFNGVIHEVSVPERIIQTFEFEGLPEKGHVALQTARFESLPGDRTRVTSQILFQSVSDRDGMVQSGMERGALDSNARLDEVLEGELVK